MYAYANVQILADVVLERPVMIYRELRRTTLYSTSYCFVLAHFALKNTDALYSTFPNQAKLSIHVYRTTKRPVATAVLLDESKPEYTRFVILAHYEEFVLCEWHNELPLVPPADGT